MTEHVDLDKRVFKLLPEQLLPSQLAKLPPLTAEQRLWWAALHDCWEGLRKYRSMSHPRARRLFQEDLAWIESAELGLLSFIWCCEVIGLNPAAIRRGMVKELARMQEQGVTVVRQKQRRAA